MKVVGHDFKYMNKAIFIDKDGTLINARMMPEDFCKDGYNLRSAHAKVVEGLIFISLADARPDFSLIEKSLSPYLKPYKINDAKQVVYPKVPTPTQISDDKT